MHRYWMTFVVLVGLPACAQTPATRPFRGVTYVHEVRRDPPNHLHVVTVDLTDPGVHVVVSRAGDDPDGEGPWETSLMRPSQIAERDHLDVAVNGDFFMPKDTLNTPLRKVPYFQGNWASTCGWAMVDGQFTSMRPAPASLLVDAKGRVTITRLGGRPPADTRYVVSGMSLFVDRGRNVGDRQPAAPHTAAGIDREGKRLVLVVVDGRRPTYSAGMTMWDLGREMVRLGCDYAIQLDGGGSSAMVVYDPANTRYDVVSRPSDGHDLPLAMSVERPVANVLGVRVDKSGDATTGPATRPAR